MKIMFLVSRFLDGGIDTVLVEYLNNLCCHAGYEVSLMIAMKLSGHEVFMHRIDKRVNINYLVDEEELTWYKRNKLTHKRSLAGGLIDMIFLNPIRLYLMRKRLRKYAESTDVIIDFDCCHGSIIDVVSDRIKKIAWFHFSIKKEMERAPRRMNRLGIHFSKYDNIVLISDSMLQEARQIYPSLSNKFIRIYNSVSLDRIERLGKENVSNSKIDTPYMLAVERLEETQKDISTLIKAYAAACRETGQNNIPKLYVMGKGRSKGELETLIYELGVQERVFLLGFNDNPYPWIKKAEFIVHSSKFEGLPTILIESLLLGKIIICTDCPTGPREILNNGKSGVLTPVGDVNRMKEAILDVIKRPTSYQHILDNAKKHSRLFTPEYSSDAIINLIENC